MYLSTHLARIILRNFKYHKYNVLYYTSPYFVILFQRSWVKLARWLKWALAAMSLPSSSSRSLSSFSSSSSSGWSSWLLWKWSMIPRSMLVIRLGWMQNFTIAFQSDQELGRGEQEISSGMSQVRRCEAKRNLTHRNLNLWSRQKSKKWRHMQVS